jgi:hypothetical protein
VFLCARQCLCTYWVPARTCEKCPFPIVNENCARQNKSNINLPACQLFCCKNAYCLTNCARKCVDHVLTTFVRPATWSYHHVKHTPISLPYLPNSTIFSNNVACMHHICRCKWLLWCGSLSPVQFEACHTFVSFFTL